MKKFVSNLQIWEEHASQLSDSHVPLPSGAWHAETYLKFPPNSGPDQSYQFQVHHLQREGQDSGGQNEGDKRPADGGLRHIPARE